MKTVDFIRKHSTCHEGAEWALSISDEMSDVWDALVEQGNCKRLLWTLSQPGVFSITELRKLACRFIRETPLHDGRTVWDLLTDERSRKAIEVVEAYADGKGTKTELVTAAADAAWGAAAAWRAAYAAASDAWAADTARAVANATNAAWAAYTAADAARAANMWFDDAGYAAAREAVRAAVNAANAAWAAATAAADAAWAAAATAHIVAHAASARTAAAAAAAAYAAAAAASYAADADDAYAAADVSAYDSAVCSAIRVAQVQTIAELGNPFKEEVADD